MTMLISSPQIPTLADLLDRLGGVSPTRVRFYPVPGTATEADVVMIEAKENRLCELVDGVLVEKPMGIRGSFIATLLSTMLNNFVLPRNLGMVTGADGMMKLAPGLIRIPDVAFISWQRLPQAQVPRQPVPHLAPDLAVEVLSEGNTQAEMSRKREEYFRAGVRLVWIIDPETRTATVFSSAEESVVLHENQSLLGGSVLPEFECKLSDLFEQLAA